MSKEVTKTMQEEMSDEWTDLAIANIGKLIPQEWMPRINEILPKVLNMLKIGIKKNIVTTAESLGNTKMMITMNFPHNLADGSTIMVPTLIKVDKSQLGPSTYGIKIKSQIASVYKMDINGFSVNENTFVPFETVLPVMGSAIHNGHTFYQIANGWIMDDDVQVSQYDFNLKDGEKPEALCSMMMFAEKISKYEKVTDLFNDIKNGKFITLEDLHVTPEQKQIASNT